MLQHAWCEKTFFVSGLFSTCSSLLYVRVMYETYKLYPRLYYSKRRDPAQSLELWGPLLDGVFSTFFFSG